MVTSADELYQQWAEFVQGKSVAVVGGYDEIEWDVVHSCDIVVRINNHWQRQRGRCDVVFHSCASDLGDDMFTDPALYTQAGLKWAWLNITHMLFGHHCGFYFQVSSLCIANGVNCPVFFHGPPRAWKTFTGMQNLPERQLWSRRCSERWNFHPLTGTLAVYCLLQTQASLVYVTGMNFYRHPSGTLPVKVGAHGIAPQVQMFKDLAAEDARLRLSPALLLLIHHNQSYTL